MRSMKNVSLEQNGTAARRLTSFESLVGGLSLPDVRLIDDHSDQVRTSTIPLPVFELDISALESFVSSVGWVSPTSRVSTAAKLLHQSGGGARRALTSLNCKRGPLESAHASRDEATARKLTSHDALLQRH